MTAPCDHRGSLVVAGDRVACTRCEAGALGLAWVDVLRALPAETAWEILDALEAELGPEAVGALETAWEFFGRPAQHAVCDPSLHGVVVIVGGYGTGKTRASWEALVAAIVDRRAGAPRIIGATGDDVRDIVLNEKTGILAWKKPGVTYEWEPSKGSEGQLTINGVAINLLSIEAPRGPLGKGTGWQILDDPPKWGPTGRAALINALKSARERGVVTLIPTTDDGLALVADVLGVDAEHLDEAGVTVINLGASEANAGNLDPNYYKLKDRMRAAGTWDPIASVSPWRELAAGERPGVDGGLTREQWARVLDYGPEVPLVEVAVSIDPSKGGSSRPCEVGIVAGGRDARDILRITHDRSAVLDGGAQGWPAVAWQLAEDLHALHPRAPFPPFVFESNVGKVYGELLFAEERNRRKDRGGPGVNARCRVEFVRADANKCVRAEGPARVAAQGQVRFASGLFKVIGQLKGLTPKGTDSDGADACNHLLTFAGKLSEGAAVVERAQKAETTRRSFEGLVAAQSAMPAPAAGAAWSERA